MKLDFDFDISSLQMKSVTRYLTFAILAPAGPTYMEDLNEAGGVYAVMNELSRTWSYYMTDCITVTGNTIGENITRL